MPIEPPRSSLPLPMPKSCGGALAQRLRRPNKRWPTVTPSRSGSWRPDLRRSGRSGRAGPLIASLASELQAEPQAYAKILEGELALKNGDPRQAIKVLTEANALLDTWLGHFNLGRAYLEAGAFIQADSEFDRCMTRRGEALSLLLDDEPTYAIWRPSTTTRVVSGKG